MNESDISKLIPRFDGTFFSLWKMQITAFLDQRDLLDVIEHPVKGIPKTGLKLSSGKPGSSGSASVTDGEEVKTPQEKENVKRSIRAYNILLLSLGKEQLQMVIDVPRGNAYGVWSALLARYERKTVASKMKLRNELHNIKFKGNENIDMYISRIKQLILSLADMGSTLSNDESIYALFKGLPSEFHATIDTLSLNDDLKFEDACSYIRDRYERIKIDEDEETKDMVAYVKDKKDTHHDYINKPNKVQKICKTCGKHGHIPFYCHENKDKLKCNYCKKVGHEQKNCWYLKREDEKPNTDKAYGIIDTDDNEEYIF